MAARNGVPLWLVGVAALATAALLLVRRRPPSPEAKAGGVRYDAGL